MRGDRPPNADIRPEDDEFTPHARGSTLWLITFFSSWRVYPACAGIDHPLEKFLPGFVRLPRMRGDRPCCYKLGYYANLFTPHARGSTPISDLIISHRFVYPACAGIDPFSSKQSLQKVCLPRMRGDRPIVVSTSTATIWFTPHARGSTPPAHLSNMEVKVYPACAGIDRCCWSRVVFVTSLPRMRGDRPS